MMGIFMPEEYGGAGMSYLTYIACCEEIAKHCATTSVIVSSHTSLCCWPILAFGTEEQKQKYLPDLCSGEKLGAFGLTEPGAGTDAAMQKTVAEDKAITGCSTAPRSSSPTQVMLPRSLSSR